MATTDATSATDLELFAKALEARLTQRPDVAKDYHAVFQGDPVGTQWLESVAVQPEPPSTAPAPAPDDEGQVDVRTLDWITPEQQSRLKYFEAARGDWHTWVPVELDRWRPSWPEANSEELTAQLDALLADLVFELLTGEPEDGDDDPAFDPRTFEWLTPEHKEQLDQLTEVKGPWQGWLGDELDLRRPEWTELTAGELASWMETLLPLLQLPGVDAVAQEMVAAVVADKQTMSQLARLTPAQLQQVVDQAMSSSAPA